MSRYFSRSRVYGNSHRPAACWGDEPPLLTSVTVDDHRAIDTGLLDHRGDPIMRAPNPMGFGRDADW